MGHEARLPARSRWKDALTHFCLPFWTQMPNADFADHVVAKA
jgi:phthalate 4,5-dioxygenase